MKRLINIVFVELLWSRSLVMSGCMFLWLLVMTLISVISVAYNYVHV